MKSHKLKNAAPVARTAEERVAFPWAAVEADALASKASSRAKRRTPAEGPTTGNLSVRTLRQMFAFNESLHGDEAGRWIAGAYSLSAENGLRTPSGNEAGEEYERVHKEMYGAPQKLVSLSQESGEQSATSTDHQAPRLSKKLGRPTKGARSEPLRSAVAAVFKLSELQAIPSAVSASRHRSEEQRALLQTVGAFAAITGANVNALEAAFGIKRRTIYKLKEDAQVYQRQLDEIRAEVDDLKSRQDRAERRHFALDSSVRNQLATLLHGNLATIEEEDARTLDERFATFLDQLTTV